MPSWLTNAGFNLVRMPQTMNSFLGGFVAPGVRKTPLIKAAIVLGRAAATAFVPAVGALGGVGGFFVGTRAQDDVECEKETCSQ